MKIKWWGHASFLITTSKNKMILTDPYNEELPYNKITDKPDYVTVSHDHFDHNAVDLLKGSPEVIKKSSGFEDDNISVKGISVYHDDAEGDKRGENIIFIINTDGYKIAHLGDLGHELNKEDLNRLKDIDILFSSNQLKSIPLKDFSSNFIVFATTSQLVKDTGQGLTGIKAKCKNNLPTNISSIKNYNMDNNDDNFLNYGNNNSKNLYLLLLEDL